MNSKKGILTVGVTVLLVGVTCLALLFAPPRLSFTVGLDGKPLPADMTPLVKVDGQPFVSGSKLGIGQHAISVSLPNAEPLNRTVWLTFGDKSLGLLRLVPLTGALNVSTYPSDCKVTLRQGTRVVGESTAPAHFTKLLLGGYDLEVEKSGSKETSHIVVDETKPKDIEVKLKLGQLALSSVPADADYTLSGGGRNWDGHLPAMLQDVPAGNYELVVRRKSWEIRSELDVLLGKTSTNQAVFTYGTISILSEPPGINISSNGVAIGKAPIILDEVRPATYTLAASDGDNELSTSITVEPNQQTNHLFAFRYGTVHLTSTPPGATVIRKGIEVGKTPLTLEHILVGDVPVELRLAGYVSTNLLLQVRPGETLDLAAKLNNERYLEAMKEARERFDSGKFEESRKLVAVALEIEPGDAAASKLQGEISEAERKAEDASRKEKADAEARALASLTWLDFQKVISDCTDNKQVQYSVDFDDGYYEDYINNEGKKTQRFHKTGQHSEIRTRTESTFDPIKFSAKYEGRTFRFNCPDKWSVSKVEKEGGIILKAGGVGSDEIRATALPSNRDALKSLQKGQKVTIKAVLKTYKEAGLFVPRILYLEDAEILNK